MICYNYLVKLVVFFTVSHLFACSTTDENGYIVYCPCMGRFGNQAEQFLGTLLFAIHLNRTLILPPFIEYQNYQVNFLPFDKFFQIDALNDKHQVMTMDKFMNEYAPTVWPERNRFIFCYSARNAVTKSNESIPDCNPFEGNPFKPFWHHFNVTKFAQSIFHSPLVTRYSDVEKWKSSYKGVKVLAFVGAPSTFPADDEALPLQKYLKFADYVKKLANNFRDERNFAYKPYLAIHLRHGNDWIRACDLLRQSKMSRLFSSHQCTHRLGMQLMEVTLPFEICSPSTGIIIDDIQKALDDSFILLGITIQTIYVATDFDNKEIWREISQALPDKDLITPSSVYLNGKQTQKNLSSPHFIIDAYLLSNADYYIGNCISSFSAFASRSRIYTSNLQNSTKFFASYLLNNQFTKDEL